ncbi:MAG: hypothetical protein FLDDKLPJ_00658 [Phycisphaerae bacterium]|nr:hypothetical protein [Phycisphaerae bacterium]
MKARTTFGIGIIAMGWAAAGVPAAAELPPGYVLEQVTRNEYLELTPRLNNLGHFVFSARYGTFEEDRYEEIILYKDGELIRLTHDTKRDRLPDINDAGTIVWSREIGPRNQYGKTAEIMMYRDGKVTRLTDNAINDHGARINNLGHIVWYQFEGQGCDNASANIMFFDGERTIQLTEGLASNQAPAINDRDEIVWTRYDFCPEGYWDSDILLWRDGEILQLDNEEDLEPQGVDINNHGTVVFQSEGGGPEPKGVRMWKDGRLSWVTGWGNNAEINDHEDIYFIRWHEANRTWQSWLYLDGVLYQLTDDPYWNTDGDINNAGQVVWNSGNVPWADIRFLYPDERQRRGEGDSNQWRDFQSMRIVPDP